MWTGVDVGHSYIKIAQIVPSWGGFRLFGIAKVKNELPADDSKTSSTIRSFARAQLQRIFQTTIVPSRCIIGVTGKDINLRIVQMPPIPSAIKFRKMMEYELIQIAGKSGESLYSDYCRLNLASKSYPEIPVLVGMAKNTFIDEQIKRMRKAGLAVEDISPNAIALSYALRQTEIIKPEETVLLADIGAVNTEIVIHQGKHLIFARNISGGGADLTETIQNRLGIPKHEAENLKINAGKIVPRETEISGEDRTLQETLRSGVGQIQSSIESAISFAIAQLKVEKLSPDRIFISGGTAKLKGLAGYLGETLNKPVEVFKPFKNIKANLPAETKDKVVETDCDFSVALGLALSGAAYNRNTHISFLPPQINKRKVFYRESIPLIAAGIIIFIGMVIWFTSVYSERARELNNIAQLKTEQKKFTDVLNKFNQAKERVKSLDDTYQKLNKITQAADLSYITIKLISRHLPTEAWISQITMSGVPTRDPKKPADIDSAREITVIGYLEDDNPYNLENLKTFVDQLNQPNDYLPIEAALKRLDIPKTVMPRAKKEFEINIKAKETAGK
ncbi:MAG: pilus assembly protein PilM [Planctomycetes bacterium]|nr:pilus assembly protein PilM [Planctomycetota bacterium]